MFILDWIPIIGLVTDVGQQFGLWNAEVPAPEWYKWVYDMFSTTVACQVGVSYMQGLVKKAQGWAAYTGTDVDDKILGHVSRGLGLVASWLFWVSQFILSVASVDPRLKERLEDIQKNASKMKKRKKGKK